jgi:hypothetical protein
VGEYRARLTASCPTQPDRREAERSRRRRCPPRLPCCPRLGGRAPFESLGSSCHQSGSAAHGFGLESGTGASRLASPTRPTLRDRSLLLDPASRPSNSPALVIPWAVQASTHDRLRPRYRKRPALPVSSSDARSENGMTARNSSERRWCATVRTFTCAVVMSTASASGGRCRWGGQPSPRGRPSFARILQT